MRATLFFASSLLVLLLRDAWSFRAYDSCLSIATRRMVDFQRRAAVRESGSSMQSGRPSVFAALRSSKSSAGKALKPSPAPAQSNDREDELQQQFQEWEQEEVETHREAVKAKQRRLVESGEEDDDFMLPEYIRNIFDELDAQQPVPEEKLPILAVIGRPNTGKSTLFNRLTNSFKDGAIVHDEPGITRDRAYRTASWNGYNFQVVDTGGMVFDDDKSDVFAEQITQQAMIALKEANAAIFVCDGQEGITPMDQQIAAWLRRHNRVPVFLAVSKCESETTGLIQAQEFWSLGLGHPYPVSGIHGIGVGDLLEQVTSNTMKKVENVIKENVTNVALVGRPNVGKSSLFNRLYGQERTIVSPVAGTTRDAIDAVVTEGDERFRIIDTAGIRKKSRIQYGPEFFMINRAFKAIRRAEVAVLVLDATQHVGEQDRILAQRITDEGRGCVIALNKWDAVPNKNDQSFTNAVQTVRTALPSLAWAEVVVLSALTGQRSNKLFEAVSLAAKQFTRRVSTSVLNEVVNDATISLSPPTIGSRAGRIYYCMQVSTAPPTIVFFVNDPDLFTENYHKYIERRIRQQLNFHGTPLHLIWRGKTLRDVSRAAKRGEMGKSAENVMGPNKATQRSRERK